MTNTIITDKARQTQHGIDAGRRDREKCLTMEDVNWYGAIATERLYHDDASPAERAWFNGYLHGLNGGQ